jgi:hypothetical protein
VTAPNLFMLGSRGRFAALERAPSSIDSARFTATPTTIHADMSDYLNKTKLQESTMAGYGTE